ncbi:hypothetical protein [Flavobacterium limnophilum]|uniref:hypothetical protein n=1 Tax=Flavobacterium limnophilum TaxID=3003262 RepID=UPI0022ABD8FD|nr:hypothetical protein [Flavobacterium limnophilum]
MKQKYILGIYDKLINEIKYNKKTTDSGIIAYLKNCSNESHYLYKIKFSRKQGDIKYAYQKRVHNLHPNAPELINSDCDINPEFKKLIPLILKELNIPDSNLEFCWTEHNILIVKQHCTLEELSKENRFFLYCFQTVFIGNSSIKESLNDKFFSLKKEEEIELFIHRKQNALQNLSHALFKVINPDNPADIYTFSADYTKMDCLKIIYLYLEKLLVFIETEYHTYLNVNNKVPYRSILVKELEIENKLNFVKSCLMDCNLNDEVFKLAYQPLLKIATIKIQKNITYNEFYYCIEYIKELYSLFQQNKKTVTESVIKHWLFELNFNSLDFFDYKTDEITKNLELLESDIEKTDLLFHLLKKFNQSRITNFRKFNQKIPSIKDQLTSWIEEEIEYLSRRKNLGINNNYNANSTEAKVKIQTSLSVAQLTYFFKILMKVKIIIHKNNADIFRFIAENFNTKSSTQISADSVKNNFYNADTNSKLRIRPFIIELLNLTK